MSGNLKKYQLFIDGKWVEANSGKYFDTVYPYTAEPWAMASEADATDVDRAVQSARAAFEGAWGATKPVDRAKLLNRFAELIESNAERLAEIESRDNGKLLDESLGQIKYLPMFYRYFAGMADKMFGQVLPLEKPNFFNYTVREPYGVIGLLTPWNSPLFIASQCIAPALASGNTIVLKPSEFTSISSLEFAALAVEAGFPPGVMNVVTGFGSPTGEALTSHPDVDKYCFVGGAATAKGVMANLAKNIKPVCMELGGKSPVIVFEDANLDNAANGVIKGIFSATGQTCIAASRLLVQENIADKFVDMIMDRIKSIRYGDPMDKKTELAPLSSERHLQRMKDFVKAGLDEGATLVCGGGQPKDASLGKGYFFEPTIFKNVNPKAFIAREDAFGPVLCVFTFKDEEDAIRQANDTEYGLCAGIWTQSPTRGIRMAGRIRAGMIWVNNARLASYASPFGGYKMSGIGRYGGPDAMLEFTQVKAVWIETSDAAIPNPFLLF
ncbi:MAG: carnitine dehydratase [Armatimonadetes bacterium RBG_16_58_9]|nr:MAG: carnitine dehydratase [Armatimonadetes bacterium RBG_16_58_9]